jgi:hypothetical protein
MSSSWSADAAADSFGCFPFFDLRAEVEAVVVFAEFEVAEAFEVTEEERALRGVERRGVDILRQTRRESRRRKDE